MAQTETVTIPSGVTTLTRDAAAYAGKRVVIGTTVYDVKYCGDYALYYLNAFGGWDAFLIEGKTEKWDDNSFNDFDSCQWNLMSYPEKQRYAIVQTTKWRLNTGWLSDDEAARLAKHLLSSPQVWLHDLKTDECVPVIINTNRAEYKKQENTPKKLVSYTIEVEAAKNKMRR